MKVCITGSLILCMDAFRTTMCNAESRDKMKGGLFLGLSRSESEVEVCKHSFRVRDKRKGISVQFRDLRNRRRFTVTSRFESERKFESSTERIKFHRIVFQLCFLCMYNYICNSGVAFDATFGQCRVRYKTRGRLFLERRDLS